VERRSPRKLPGAVLGSRRHCDTKFVRSQLSWHHQFALLQAVAAAPRQLSGNWMEFQRLRCFWQRTVRPAALREEINFFMKFKLPGVEPVSFVALFEQMVADETVSP